MQAIVAMDSNRGIGKDNGIPWYIQEDLLRFKEITTGGWVVMGSKTWASLPDKRRPLPKRQNVVISQRHVQVPKGVMLASGRDELLDLIEQNGVDLENVFIIGGSEIYRLFENDIQTVHVTQIFGDYDCDRKFPLCLDENWNVSVASSLNGTKGRFEIWQKK